MGSSSARFYILDLLRFIAALGVLIYHYSVFFKSDEDSILLNASSFGYLGVVFFFLLSGFVISISAGKYSAGKFLFSRAVRLYPAFISCLLLTVCTVYVVSHKTWPIKDIMANGFIVNDYFKIANIDGVYWTLQAELKFYCCIFGLLLLGLFKFHRLWLSFWLAAAITYYFFKQPFFLGWFISPDYSFYFIGGVAAYFVYKSKSDLWAHSIFLISLIFGCMAAAKQTGDFISHVSAHTGVVAGGVVLLFYLFFFVLAKGGFEILKVPRWWGYLGAMSYPIYLLHDKFGKTFISLFVSEIGILPSLVLVTGFVMLIALCLHLYVEKPLAAYLNSVNKKYF